MELGDLVQVISQVPAMSLIYEFLLILRKEKSKPCDPAVIWGLLKSDSDFAVSEGGIRFQNKLTCECSIERRELPHTEWCHHLRFVAPASDTPTDDELATFTAMLRRVREATAILQVDTEVLRDDLTFHYACKGYSIIHEIENLMRHLITQFMLLSVGRDWLKTATPPSVKKAISEAKKDRETPESPNAEKKTDAPYYLNALHRVDFDILGEFLFTSYPLKAISELYKAIGDASADDLATLQTQVAALKSHIPLSNWDRFFKQHVKCDASFLQGRWNALYGLRCDVAHNRLMGKRELDMIRKHADDIRPHLEAALNKVPSVRVPEDQAAAVAQRDPVSLEDEVLAVSPEGFRVTRKYVEGSALLEPLLNQMHDTIRRVTAELTGKGTGNPMSDFQALRAANIKVPEWIESEFIEVFHAILPEGARKHSIHAGMTDSLLSRGARVLQALHEVQTERAAQKR
jgi:hypothetical protein